MSGPSNSAATAPIRSLSAEQYHAAAGVSKTMLNILARQSPFHLKAWMGEKPEEDTPAARLGTILHRSILEPDTMEGAFYVKPAGMKFTTKDGIAWRDSHTDRHIVTADEAEMVRRCRDAVHAHPLAKRLLAAQGQSEVCVFVEDDEGTLRKSRIDRLPESGNVVPDIKTVESADMRFVNRRRREDRWAVQAAYYLDNLKLAQRPMEEMIFITLERSFPYAVACYRLLPEMVRAARQEYKTNLAVFSKCVAENHWPGYGDGGPIFFEPEPWEARTLEAFA